MLKVHHEIVVLSNPLVSSKNYRVKSDPSKEGELLSETTDEKPRQTKLQCTC